MYTRNIYQSSVLLTITFLSIAASGQEPFRDFETIPDHLAYLYAPAETSEPSLVFRQLVAGDRRWENGRTLRVCLFRGNAVVAQLIREVAGEWNRYSGVKLDFGAKGHWYDCLSPSVGFPEVRIGFGEQGYWSYLGTDSERFGGERAPSMNLAGFNVFYRESKYTLESVIKLADSYHKATIKHEFGHALGLLHEHQNLNLDCQSEIKFNGAGSVYEYYGKAPNYWTKEQVDRNLGFIGLTDPDFIAGEPDPKSIMMYNLDPNILKKGEASRCYTQVNYEISEKDKLIISKIYPLTGNNNLVVDNDLSKTSVKAPPVGMIDQDYLLRLNADLESTDVATRRNARGRLSAYIKIDTTDQLATQLLEKISEGSYRQKLGLAVAISELPDPIQVSATAIEAIESQKAKEKDPVLIRSYDRALNKIGSD